MPNNALLLSLRGMLKREIKDDVWAILQFLCLDSIDLDNKYIVAAEAMVLPSQATKTFHNLFLSGIIHLGHGLRVNLTISLNRVLTSATSLTSLVLRSRSFSANEVMSQALLRSIFKDDFSGPKNGPNMSKLWGVILDSIVLVTTMFSTNCSVSSGESPTISHVLLLPLIFPFR